MGRPASRASSCCVTRSACAKRRASGATSSIAASELLELAELATSDDDPELATAVDADYAALESLYASHRTALLFNGEYDDRNALLTISAGAGGTEATDWAQMLLRMYLRWAERHRFATEILDLTEGEEVGVKSVTVAVDGRSAYGFLRAERGVHRLVRISPFDSQKRRQTTFALIEVLPEVEDEVEVEIDPDELRIDTFRATGHGGQNVNKTDSAVRITHLPTGIVTQSQNERSQLQNKDTAMKVLRARLLERALEEREARDGGPPRRARRGRLGAPDPLATSSTPTRWSRTSGPSTRRATPGPCWTATSTPSCARSSSGWPPPRRRRGPPKREG